MDYPKKPLILCLTILFSVGLLLAACAAPAAPAVTDLPLTATVEASPLITAGVAPTAEATVLSTVFPSEEAEPTGEAGELRPLSIESVNVEIGVGSPIPVEVVASATWPDLCAQLAEVRHSPSEDGFAFTVLASPPEADCPPDAVGLPVRLALPLNMAEMPPGTYRVEINGVEASFDWMEAGQVQRPQPAIQATDLRPIRVEAVNVEIGVGSPIPVDILVSGTWPDLCAQLAQVRQTFADSGIEISLLATPADPACPPDQLGLPFRLAIPLNMLEKPAGPYSVAVNGVETGFDWTGEGGQPSEGANPLGAPVAYIGEDGNIWLLGADGETRQVTQDATPRQEGAQPAESIAYYWPRLAPDASLLAYRRDAGTPVESGMQFEVALWVYDLAAGEARQILDQAPAGYSWMPGSHTLAYGLGVADDYFMNPVGEPGNPRAKGLWAVDLDQGEPFELVPAERGYSLFTPVWSPDGRLISFDEVHNMEGRGLFAYYDLVAQEYTSWDEPIGNYSLSPDASQIVYDRLVYVPIGDERIFLRDRRDGGEQAVSPGKEGEYAFWPTISPQGDSVAYLAGEAGTDSQIYTVYVQALPDGEARPLGQFESVLNLNWSPDGQYLVFSAGPYESQQLMAVRIADGNVFELARGSLPDLASP